MTARVRMLWCLVALVACDRAQSSTHVALAEATPHTAQPQDDSTARGHRLAAVTDSRRTAIVQAAARAAPSVVSVNVVRRERRVARGPFDFFFVPREYERLVEGLGSGFVVSTDGIVITNQHVTSGAERLVVTTRDGEDLEAELLGEDPLTDIAVLRIEAGAVPAAPLGRSESLLIGEWVVAIGNPYGYLLGNAEPSVSAGVVSAVGRNLLPSGEQPGIYVGMIQTDAAINPGNSGGPLVDARGAVVGVNSSIFSNSGGSIGIGFAIPIERALRVADELARYGEVRRAWVGLDVAGQEDLRGWKRTGGIEVSQVSPGGPADRAGLRSGDILLSAAGSQLRTFLDWEAVELDIGPGDSLPVQFRRGDRERRAVLIVEALPTSKAERISVLGDMELITVTPAIQQERSLGRPYGALVYDIGDEAQRATHLAPGDVILQVNRERIRRAEQVDDALRRAARRGPIRLWFERAGRLLYADFYVR